MTSKTSAQASFVFVVYSRPSSTDSMSVDTALTMFTDGSAVCKVSVSLMRFPQIDMKLIIIIIFKSNFVSAGGDMKLGAWRYSN